MPLDRECDRVSSKPSMFACPLAECPPVLAGIAAIKA